MSKININNHEYDFEALSDQSKAHVVSIQFCDQELQRLKSKVAAYQTARQVYSKALQAALATEAVQGEKISFN